MLIIHDVHVFTDGSSPYQHVQRLSVIQLKPSSKHAFTSTPVALGDSADLKTHFQYWTLRVNLQNTALKSVVAKTILVGGPSIEDARTIDATTLDPHLLELVAEDADRAESLAQEFRRAITLCKSTTNG